jgi:hypothetical protein
MLMMHDQVNKLLKSNVITELQNRPMSPVHQSENRLMFGRRSKDDKPIISVGATTPERSPVGKPKSKYGQNMIKLKAASKTTSFLQKTSIPMIGCMKKNF